MPRPMTVYRSGIQTAHTSRHNACPGCGDHVVQRRTFRSVTAVHDAEEWRSQKAWCRSCVRESARKAAGL